MAHRSPFPVRQVVQDQAPVRHDLGQGHGGQPLGHGWESVDGAPSASQQRHLPLGRVKKNHEP